MMLKEKCSMTDSEWEERQKTRQLEMEACSKALAVLSGDDAHDLFTKTFNFVQKSAVKDSIQKMVDDLMKEKEDEIAFKDYCIDAMNTNEQGTSEKNKEKDDLVAKIDDLTNTVSTLAGEIDGLKNSIAEMRLQMKRSGEDRELENKAFMETV